MKIRYVNCGWRNGYESDLRSNEHYLSSSENKVWVYLEYLLFVPDFLSSSTFALDIHVSSLLVRFLGDGHISCLAATKYDKYLKAILRRILFIKTFPCINISIGVCSVCSYLDKYLSNYVIFILLVSTPLTAVTWLCSNIIVCNLLHDILIKQLCRALGLCTLYSIVVYNEP